MEKPLLSDKEQYPAEDIIFSNIGKHRTLWVSFFDYIHAEHPDYTEEWRYYNDGKRWLMKVQKKNRTVFWLSLVDETFRTTFYFSAKGEQSIMESSISAELKDQYRCGNKNAKIRGITVLFKSKKDFEQAKILCVLKNSIKQEKYKQSESS